MMVEASKMTQWQLYYDTKKLILVAVYLALGQTDMQTLETLLLRH
jgi:hypothetical protein